MRWKAVIISGAHVWVKEGLGGGLWIQDAVDIHS